MIKTMLKIAVAFTLMCSVSCSKKEAKMLTATDKVGNSYQYVENDPMKVRLYELDNGLKIYLSQNTEEPRINTYIAVRAGSNQDPDDATGLAHYLEHMLFKGTSKFGTTDWESEKLLLKEISDLYETYRKETDAKKRKAIYKKIDAKSNQAATYAIANEYDNMINALGAKGTNAHTWYDETVYKNDIPSNELEKWLKIEKERMSQVVLRLFHTELETVYEEYNRGQDSDSRRAFTELAKGLFPTHPYGQKPTIGFPEHLKSPSMVRIHEYFDTYYVPNNMAIAMSGDLDFEKTVELISTHFGKMKSKKVNRPKMPVEKAIQKPVIKEVSGPQADMIYLGYRTEGVSSKDRFLGELFSKIASNGQAGLLDVNLNKSQKVLYAGAGNLSMKDYGMVYFVGQPNAGQTLDEVAQLIIEQIELIKSGKVDKRLILGAKNQFVKEIQKQIQGNSRAQMFYQSFIYNTTWDKELQVLEDLKNVTIEEVIAFAKKTFKNNYVLIKKKKGPNDKVTKVEKPEITPVTLNRKDESPFKLAIKKTKTSDIKPVFNDFAKEITESEVNGLKMSYVKNSINDLFEINIIWDFGLRHFKELRHAASIIDYVGTDKLTNEEISMKLYEAGAEFSFSLGKDRTTLKISGLEKEIDKAWNNTIEWVMNAKGDSAVYQNYIGQVMQERENTRNNKRAILRAIQSYMQFGEESDLRNVMSLKDFKSTNSQEILDLLKKLFEYKHEYFFYGVDFAKVKAIASVFEKGKKYIPNPTAKINPEQKKPSGSVLVVDYDMVQAEILMNRKVGSYNVDEASNIRLYNSYYGSGLSSIVFQEIREAKALAYSAYSYLASPSNPEENVVLHAYIGTQKDKLNEATISLLDLFDDMTKSEQQFEAAKSAVLKKIASDRFVRKEIFWRKKYLDKFGFKDEINKTIYADTEKATMKNFEKYFNKNVRGTKFNFGVIGKYKELDKRALKKLGKIKKMEIKYLFNH